MQIKVSNYIYIYLHINEKVFSFNDYPPIIKILNNLNIFYISISYD